MALLGTPRRRFILASASPRRQQLLSLIFDNFEIVESQIDENISADIAPASIVKELAYAKARQVAGNVAEGIILGADSVVVLDGQILGKPRNLSEAERMLQQLSGKTHEVYTGFAIIEKPGSWQVNEAVGTTVRFRPLEAWEIRRYLEVGQPLDKAGAYGIQNEAALFVESISGCYYNVMGLPVSAIFQALRPLFSNIHDLGEA